MRLFNRGPILAGIALFLIAATFPFWWRTLGRPAGPPDLKLDTPEIAALVEKRCVEPAAFMRAYHMKLLDEWRDAVVREDRRTHTAADGRIHTMSLTGTCLACHSNKAQFCDRCHDYAAAKPRCWSCHITSEEARR
jgi:hypothetical protein